MSIACVMLGNKHSNDIILKRGSYIQGQGSLSTRRTTNWTDVSLFSLRKGLIVFWSDESSMSHCHVIDESSVCEHVSNYSVAGSLCQALLCDRWQGCLRTDSSLENGVPPRFESRSKYELRWKSFSNESIFWNAERNQKFHEQIWDQEMIGIEENDHNNSLRNNNFFCF